MPLYEVTIERVLLVVADNESEAYFVAKDNERESVGDYDGDVVSVNHIAKAADIPKEWKNAVPYGGDGNSRVEAYVPADNSDLNELLIKAIAATKGEQQ